MSDHMDEKKVGATAADLPKETLSGSAPKPAPEVVMLPVVDHADRDAAAVGPAVHKPQADEHPQEAEKPQVDEHPQEAEKPQADEHPQEAEKPQADEHPQEVQKPQADETDETGAVETGTNPLVRSVEASVTTGDDVDDTAETEKVVETPERETTTWTDPAWADAEVPANQTVVLPTIDARDRDAERQQRARALGLVTTNVVDQGPVFLPPPTRTTDKWHGSLGMFLLRLVTALIIGLHGVQHLRHLTWTTDYFSHSVLPKAQYVGIGVAVAELVIAGLLVLGLMARVAGLLLVVLEVGLLVFYVWGRKNPLQGYIVGAAGELELLLAAVGLLFLLLGAGGWAIDRRVRRNNLKRKEKKALGAL